MKKHEKPIWNHKNHENRPGTMKNQPLLSKNVTDAGSQLTFEMGDVGGAEIRKKQKIMLARAIHTEQNISCYKKKKLLPLI